MLAALARQFEQESGEQVNAGAAGGVEVAKRVSGGEVVDVVVLAGTAIDKLTAEGRLLPARVDLVKAGIGLAVPSGAPQPDLSSEDAVRRAGKRGGLDQLLDRPQWRVHGKTVRAGE